MQNFYPVVGVLEKLNGTIKVLQKWIPKIFTGAKDKVMDKGENNRIPGCFEYIGFNVWAAV